MLGKKSYRITNLENNVNNGYILEKYEQLSKELEFESDVQKSQRHEAKVRTVSYLSLFRYSSRIDRYYIAGGIFFAIIGAAFLPLINILYGDFCNVLINRQYPSENVPSDTFILKWFGGGKVLKNASAEERRAVLKEDSIAWGVGCAVFSFFWFLFAALAFFSLNIAAAKQILKIKLLFFKAVICQDMVWFDTQMDGNFVGKIADNLKKVENGIGGVVGIVVHLLATFIIGVIMAFFYGWQLTLAILSVVPVAIAIAVISHKMQSKSVARELEALTAAGKNAEEVFTCIKTVVAFGGEEKEIERYSRNLMISRLNGIKQGLILGINEGLLWLIMYSCYAIGLSYGIRLIATSRENQDEIYTTATLLLIFYNVFSGLVNTAFIMIHMRTFAEACGAAGSIFDVISSKGSIQPCSDAGEIGGDCKGEIEFKNVHFEYSSRKNVKILKGLNLKVKAGEIVAIVGESGSGKSTILQLIQRMYDPSEGEILLDGKNIKQLKVSWLRQQLGVVSQEPLLFSTTIRENILYGFSEATQDDVVEAAKKANADDFITKQINGYETLIGQRGSTLSGGQKQRIAIARALIRNPKILLLDEATSALDAVSEKIVQAALDRAAVGRTTFIVTHKLSTISNVDRVIVISDGIVAEDGSVTDLYNAKGKYYELLQSQTKNIKDKNKANLESKISTSPSSITIAEESPIKIRSKFTISNASLEKQLEDHEKLDRVKKVKFREILKWNKPEWCFLIIGSLAAVLAGAALPSVITLLGLYLGLLAAEDITTVLDESDIYVLLIFAVGCFSCICIFFQIYCFTVAGMKLAERLRLRAFKSIIYQDLAWFDDEKNKVGALCLKLTQEPMRVQAGTGSRIGILLQAFSTAIIALIVSLFFAWKLTLVTLAAIPFVFIGAYLENIFGRKPRYILNLCMENASKIATEVIANIKVVQSFGKESYFIGKYTEAIYEGKKSSIYLSWLQGLAFGFGQAGPFFCYSISLWYGGYLVAIENIEYKYILTVSEMLIFGTWTLSQCVVFLSGFREARESAGKLQYLFNCKPQIFDGQLSNFPNMRENGILKFSKVRFAYPKKSNIPVLENFNATIKGGQSIAIMGPSGSGKSTVVQLLLRFYDPDFGKITANSFGTNEFKLSTLRQQFGLVSQEPVLFDRTVFENIAYGDNSRNVLKFEVVEAAKAANIHNFISRLPLEYETKLGVSGAHLSGGQKQRIAIARALVRNPQILLLDEATSALDPQSESIVQEALDNASSGRTIITIAHRLGAVRNADVIYVLDKGIIQEYGTHQELISRRGLYFRLHEEDEKKNTENIS